MGMISFYLAFNCCQSERRRTYQKKTFLSWCLW